MKKSEIAILTAAYEASSLKPAPVAESEIRVLRSFLRTHQDLIADHLVLDDIWWTQNFEGMSAYLRELGIREFILANSSTELMELLVYLLGNGYRVAGPAAYARKFDDPATDPARTGLLIEDVR